MFRKILHTCHSGWSKEAAGTALDVPGAKQSPQWLGEAAEAHLQARGTNRGRRAAELMAGQWEQVELVTLIRSYITAGEGGMGWFSSAQPWFCSGCEGSVLVSK